MTGKEIRKRFLDFFQRQTHLHRPSSGLIPRNDPTLMFTNAGMVQFKSCFLGLEKPAAPRVVTVQKCVRAGGKHNDLENVGRTARHHTFFEMLGNFSFGDYFKREAITMAWNFVTRELALPRERLLVTVYSKDDEAYDIWHRQVGLPAEMIIRIPTNDNFWSMGETGPCGPCSEIFYDYGPTVAGGPPGSAESEGDRFVEIWNLVFMQYDRDKEGTLTPLPRPCIDTGAGLERMASILQGCHSNYDSDLFQPLIQAAATLAAVPYGQADKSDVSLRVIADHLRAVTFLITDGVLPANEGRGYVLRRIMRRAMRHGRLLGLTEPFLYRLVAELIQVMGEAYPELMAQENLATQVIRIEEQRFIATLDAGLRLLEEALAPLAAGEVLDGAAVFTLYDTYGFPTDLTADIARDRQVTLDMAGFESRMAEQRRRARAAWAGSGDARVAGVFHDLRESHGATEFLGYLTESAEAGVAALVCQGEAVPLLATGQSGEVVVNQTPFYAESGGQSGDNGVIRWEGGEFQVIDTWKPLPDLFAHRGRVVRGQLAVNTPVTLDVDSMRRRAIRLHHSATHLLHHALRQVLGSHVKQAGSLVAAERLRFDFSHFQALTGEELSRIEALVNEAILGNILQETVVMTPEEAVAQGAMALFGEKYGEQVRVVQIGASVELCGGTHVQRSGDIGLCRIVSEGAVAAGIRRIEAVCGPVARRTFQEDAQRLREAASLLKLPPDRLQEGIEKLLVRQKELEKSLEQARVALSGAVVEELLARVNRDHAVPLLASRVTGVEAKELRELLDRLKDRMGSGVLLLAVVEAGKVTLAAGVTRDLVPGLSAGNLIQTVAPLVGGKGGGKPDMAMGGGDRPERLEQALAAAHDWLKQKT